MEMRVVCVIRKCSSADEAQKLVDYFSDHFKDDFVGLRATGLPDGHGVVCDAEKTMELLGKDYFRHINKSRDLADAFCSGYEFGLKEARDVQV